MVMNTLLYCTIMLAFFDESGYGDTYVAKIGVEGKLLIERKNTYIVDFSESVKNLPIVGTPSNYSKVEVDKDECRL